MGRERIAIYGGTFDPPHNGHGIVAEKVSRYPGIGAVWIMPTPQNPNKSRKATDPFIRGEMLAKMFAFSDKISVSTFQIDKEIYRTIDLLEELDKKFGEKFDFIPVIGSDCLAEIDTWKDYDKLLSKYGIIVYPRKGEEINPIILNAYPKIEILPPPYPEMNISSTMIRDMIRNNIVPRFLIPESIYPLIHQGNLYKNDKV